MVTVTNQLEKTEDGNVFSVLVNGIEVVHDIDNVDDMLLFTDLVKGVLEAANIQYIAE